MPFKMPEPYKTFLSFEFSQNEHGYLVTLVHQEKYGADFYRSSKRFAADGYQLQSDSVNLQIEGTHTHLPMASGVPSENLSYTAPLELVHRLARCMIHYNMVMNGLSIPRERRTNSHYGKIPAKPDEWLKLHKIRETMLGDKVFFRIVKQACVYESFNNGEQDFVASNGFRLMSSGCIQIDAGTLRDDFLYVMGTDDWNQQPSQELVLDTDNWKRFELAVKEYNEHMEKMNPREGCPSQAEAEPLVISAVEVQEGSAMVKVTYGVNVLEQPAGLTVGQIRERLAGVMGIPAGAQAELNGEAADSSRTCEPGDELEFVRVAGSKG